MYKVTLTAIVIIFCLSLISLSHPAYCQVSRKPSLVTQDQLSAVRTIANQASTQAQSAKTTATTANLNSNVANRQSAIAIRHAGEAQTTAAQSHAIAVDAQNRANRAETIATETNQKNFKNTVLVNRFWVLIAALLVFFMQAGFKCLEVGASRQNHSSTVGIMNLMNWLVLCLLYYCIGYGIMFGHQMVTNSGIKEGAHGSYIHFVGNHFYWPSSEALLYKQLGLEYFLFQLAFAATTATIVDGAIAERTKMSGYIWVLAGISVIIYPLFGHWAWNDQGWLKIILPDSPFHDFAGSTVVHSVGAWIALTGIYFVGNRVHPNDRFNQPSDGLFADTNRFTFRGCLLLLKTALLLAFGMYLTRDRRQVRNEIALSTAGKQQFNAHNLGYGVLGVIMLWFGWWGFNGGSKLEYSYDIANIILHTNLAGAAAGIAAYYYARWQGDAENLYPKVIGGVLGGLVAITASCDVVTPGLAIFIGIVAGIIHNNAYDFLLRKRIDDVAGAIPVHGTCGVWGTIMAGIAVCWHNNYKFQHSWSLLGHQTLVQICGIGAAILFSVVAAWCLFYAVDKLTGVRA